MQVLILTDAARLSNHAAGQIAAQLRAQPGSVLGLATGATMAPVYARLIAAHRAGLSFARMTSFNLDEYVGLGPHDPGSYHRQMRDMLFAQCDADPARCHLPRGDAPDPEAEANRYEAAIAAAGGVDLQVLGLGQNGHIGFNEPPADPGSRSRVVTLAATTRAANRRHFPAAQPVPRRAITMGIATILSARHCLLLATGAAKAQAVAAMLQGPVTPDCPASALRRHPRVTVLLDPPAASALRPPGQSAAPPAA